MSDECESVDFNDSSSDDECSTIPLHYLHPLFLERGEYIISDKNKSTFIQTKESVEAAVKSWGPSISYIKEEFITYELCSKAIENCSESICGIKPHLLTDSEYYELCLQAISVNGCNLKYIPRYVQTQELTDIALNRSCIAIPYCLEKYKTYENCLAVVKKNGQLIQYVPIKFIDKEMCLAAVASNYPCLNYIPAEFITLELCETAVKANGGNIEWIPDKYMSSALGLSAVSTIDLYNDAKRSAINIKHIPAKYITKDIIIEAVKRIDTVYSFVPNECITDEIENAVLDIAPQCIKFMKQTPEKCMRAITKNPYIIQNYISKENLTQKMVDYVLSLQYIKYQYSEQFVEYIQAAVVSQPYIPDGT